MSGIYQIYNSITNKRYIGSSINVTRRLKEHLRNLSKNRHHNIHLQNAYNKYKDFLEFRFLEECSPEECLLFEQYYLDYYKSYLREFGYNIDPEAKCAGKHPTEETKEKIRNKALGRKQTSETIEKVRLANLGKKKIKQSETMKRKYREESYRPPRFYEQSIEKQKQIRTNLSKATKQRYSNYDNRPKSKCLKFNQLDGTIIYFYSLHEAAEVLGVDRGGIKYALQNKDGFMQKVNGVFIEISFNEFKSLKNPVVGEKK